jgi:hypothetical protein
VHQFCVAKSRVTSQGIPRVIYDTQRDTASPHSNGPSFSTVIVLEVYGWTIWYCLLTGHNSGVWMFSLAFMPDLTCGKHNWECYTLVWSTERI